MGSLPDIASLNAVGVVGICVAVVLAFAFEVIVPGRSYRRALADKDEQIAELRAANARLVEVGRTVEAMASAVTRRAEEVTRQ